MVAPFRPLQMIMIPQSLAHFRGTCPIAVKEGLTVHDFYHLVGADAVRRCLVGAGRDH